MWVKLDACEIGKSHGITLDDAVKVAPMVEAAGANAITVAAYHYAGQGKLHFASNNPHEPSAHLKAAGIIKRAFHVLVIASGRVEVDVGDVAGNEVILIERAARLGGTL